MAKRQENQNTKEVRPVKLNAPFEVTAIKKNFTHERMCKKVSRFQYITALKDEVLDHLRQIRHAPSVQMQEVPPDLLDPDEVPFPLN